MHYIKHFLVCHNQKEGERRCCGRAHGDEALKRLRAGLKAAQATQCRADAVTCLGRCGLGPCVVVYPEGRWYRYTNMDTLEAVLHSELNNKPYEPALLPETTPSKV